MSSFLPPRGGSPSPALPAVLRATHLLGLALGSAFGRLRESGSTTAGLFMKAEEQALLLRMTREAAEILGARWDRVPERQRRIIGPSSVTGSSAFGVAWACRNARRRPCFECRSRRSLGGRWRR